MFELQRIAVGFEPPTVALPGFRERYFDGMDDLIYFTAGFEVEARRAAELIGFERVEPMESLPPERRLSSSVMLHVIVGAG